MKKGIVITIIILMVLLSLFILTTTMITKYTGFAISGHTIKEEIPEKCITINKNPNNDCRKGG